MKEVLHVGCGAATIRKMAPGFQQGWREVRFDINPDVHPDIVGTIADMSGVKDESVDAIYSSHNVEHVYAHQVPDVLKEFCRVLKPEGFLVVTCPNIVEVAKFVAEGRLVEPIYMSPAGPISALDIIYGHGASIENGEDYMAHRTAFTSETLGAALRAAGFGSSGIRKQRLDLWGIAIKPGQAADRVRALMVDYLPAKPAAAAADKAST